MVFGLPPARRHCLQWAHFRLPATLATWLWLGTLSKLRGCFLSRHGVLLARLIRTTEAIISLEGAFRLAQGSNNIDGIIEAEVELSSAYYRTGQYERTVASAGRAEALLTGPSTVNSSGYGRLHH